MEREFYGVEREYDPARAAMRIVNDQRRKSVLPDYAASMKVDDGRFNHILYQAGPWAEWNARAGPQVQQHGLDGTNLREATQFETALSLIHI